MPSLGSQMITACLSSAGSTVPTGFADCSNFTGPYAYSCTQLGRCQTSSFILFFSRRILKHAARRILAHVDRIPSWRIGARRKLSALEKFEDASSCRVPEHTSVHQLPFNLLLSYAYQIISSIKFYSKYLECHRGLNRSTYAQEFPPKAPRGAQVLLSTANEQSCFSSVI